MLDVRPVLVVTDVRDDLQRHCGVIRVHGDGHLSSQGGDALNDLKVRVADSGVLVLAREASVAAKNAIASLCAVAREKKAPAVLLRREDSFKNWPAHPVSAFTDIPAGLFLDARAAWTAQLDSCWRHRRFFTGKQGRLRLFTGDRRAGLFLATLATRDPGFFVPSILDDNAHYLRLPRGQLDIVPGHRAGCRSYSQAWVLEPHDGAHLSTAEHQPLLITDLGAHICSDVRVNDVTEFANPEAATARALAALHQVDGDYATLAEVVDIVVPPRAENDVRPTVLNYLQAALGHPPRWRRSSVAGSWDREIEDAGLVPLIDELSELRLRVGLENDNDGEGPNQICVVACEAKADRLLPDVGWRRRIPVFSKQSFSEEREGHLRALFFGEEGGPDDPAADEAETCVVPHRNDGSPSPLFHIVRYGDRLPRREPALIVLMGSETAVASVAHDLDACGAPLLACTTGCPASRSAERGVVLEGRGVVGSRVVPNFLSTRALLFGLQTWLHARGDEVFPLNIHELAQATFLDDPHFGHLEQEELVTPVVGLIQIAHRISARTIKKEYEPVFVHISAPETEVSPADLVSFFDELGTRCVVGASPSNNEGEAHVTIWWSRAAIAGIGELR